MAALERVLPTACQAVNPLRYLAEPPPGDQPGALWPFHGDLCVAGRQFVGVAALHAAANWTQGNLVGVLISGRLGAGGTLVNLDIGGPGWLAGGGFGPEGGLLMTATLLLGVLVLFWWPRP